MKKEERFETMIKHVVDNNYSDFKDNFEVELKSRFEDKLKQKLSEINQKLFGSENINKNKDKNNED